MKDEYNVARYIPKKYHGNIEAIEMELDFDNKKNRTVYHYFVYFKDNEKTDGIGIKETIKKIREKLGG